jgi:hypothetical protein
LETELL